MFDQKFTSIRLFVVELLYCENVVNSFVLLKVEESLPTS